MTKRLEELGIQYETTEFASRQTEHSLQSTYARQVEQDADLHGCVIFGPFELATGVQVNSRHASRRRATGPRFTSTMASPSAKADSKEPP